MATNSITRPLEPRATVLLRAVLVPTSTGTAYQRKDVLIKDGKLATVAEANTVIGDFDEEIDGSERMLLPGFFNGHAHSLEHWTRGLIKPLPLELWVCSLVRHGPFGEEGWRGDKSFVETPSDAVFLASLACGTEALLSGCTAILDHLFVRNIDDIGAASRAYRALGIR